jgi:Putative Ig domain.
MNIFGSIRIFGAVRLKKGPGSAEIVSWLTEALLGSVENMDEVRIELRVKSNKGAAITYALISGELPEGIDLDGNVLVGQPTGHGTYEFTVRASSGETFADRTFALVVEPKLSWVTDAGLAHVEPGQEVNRTLVASMSDGSPVSYALIAGSLPSGVTLSSNGLLSGAIPTEADEDVFRFTVRASAGGKTADREFTFPVVVPPMWVNSEGEIASVGIDEEFSTILSVDSSREVSFEIIDAPPETVSVTQI